MRSRSQEFYWLPSEQVIWLSDIARKFHTWIVIVQGNNQPAEISIDDLSEDKFCGSSEVLLQLFLGDRSIVSRPQWIEGQRRKGLDFRTSYAIQYNPSMLVYPDNILLEGYFAIFSKDRYEDPEKAQQLTDFFMRLKKEMSRRSDKEAQVVQRLSSGVTKSWPNIMLGRNIVESKVRLKQFVRGGVEFIVENK